MLTRKKRGSSAAGPSRILFALALVLLAPEAARAQAPDAHARAESQFKKGRAAMDRGDCKTALELFRESQKLEPGRGKLLNMGICEERLGMIATAVGHFQEVQKQLPPNDDRRPIVEESLKKLTPKVPHLRIDAAPGAPPAGEITLDGEPLEPGRLGADIALDPGKHVVIVKAPDAPEKRYEATLAVGKRSTITLDPGPASDPAPEVAPAKKSLVPAIVLGAAGVAGLAVGAGLAGAYAGKRSEAEALHQGIVASNGTCAAGAPGFDGTRCPALKDAALTGDAFSTGSIVAFVVGGAAAVGAVGYMLFWPAPKAAPTSGTTFHLAPFVTSQQQGIAAWGSF